MEGVVGGRSIVCEENGYFAIVRDGMKRLDWRWRGGSSFLYFYGQLVFGLVVVLAASLTSDGPAAYSVKLSLALLLV